MMGLVITCMFKIKVVLVLRTFVLHLFSSNAPCNQRYFLICAVIFSVQRPLASCALGRYSECTNLTVKNKRTARSLQTTSVTVRSLFSSGHLVLFPLCKSFLFYLRKPIWHTKSRNKRKLTRRWIIVVLICIVGG